MRANSSSGMEIDPGSIDLTPPGVGIDPALGDLSGKDLHGMTQAILGPHPRLEDGPCPEAVSDPAHAGELRRRNGDLQSLSPDGGIEDELALVAHPIVDR